MKHCIYHIFTLPLDTLRGPGQRRVVAQAVLTQEASDEQGGLCGTCWRGKVKDRFFRVG